MSDAKGFTPDPVVRSKGLKIGCIGAGMIMAECHLAAYKEAGFTGRRHCQSHQGQGGSGGQSLGHPQGS